MLGDRLMIVPRLCAALENLAHRHGHCLIDPPSWAYDLTLGEYADSTVKPLNPANIWWRFGQWALNNAAGAAPCGGASREAANR
jgi:hypothetical protein